MDGALGVDGAAPVHRVIVPATNLSGAGLDLDQVVFSLMNAVPHIVVHRFSGADGDQILERDVALADKFQIFPVQHRAALLAAGAATAAVVGTVWYRWPIRQVAPC